MGEWLQNKYRHEVELRLSSIADLKVAGLVEWRKDRAADAEVLGENALFCALARRFLEPPGDPEAEGLLRNWLSQVRAANGYDRLVLRDDQGLQRLSVPDSRESDVPNAIKNVLNNTGWDQTSVLDFHRDVPGGPVHLSTLVPLKDGRNDKPFGMLSFFVDPRSLLYPTLGFWPTPSRTAETLIVRREGDDALFLSDLRFRDDAALDFRIPLTRTEVPAVMAVLGQEGIVEGIDYRGTPVIAAIRAVPDSPWFLVARMDKAEADGPLRQTEQQLLLLAGALIFFAGSGSGLLWRQRNARFYRERYESAEALREQEERLRAIFECAPDAIVLADRSGVVLDANPSACRLHGIERERIIGKNLADTFPPGRGEHFARHFPRLAESQRDHIEGEVWNADGHATPVEIRASRVHLRGMSATLFHLSDITERKQAEDTLHASQQIIEKIVDAIPARVFWKDRNLVYLGCNTAFARDAGFADPKDIIGKDDYQMGWREQADLYRGADRRVIESGRPELLVEEPQTTPEGNTIALLTSKVPLRSSTGEISGVLGTYMDITELKQTLEELRKLKTLIDHANFGVAIVDLGGDILSINESFAGAHGYEARELVGKSLRIFHSAEQLPGAMELNNRLLEFGEYSLEEVWHRHRDGHAFPMLMNGVLIRDEKGKPLFLGATAIDITGPKDLEERLRQSQKMEAIGTLAGGIAHDFNNILYSIVGFTELAMNQAEKDTPPFRYLEQVLVAGKRAKDLVNQILAFSRRTESDVRSFRLQSAVREAVRFLEAARDPAIEVRSDLDAECGTVLGDSTAIHQIVMNLGVNAFHAMRGKGGVLAIRLRERVIDEGTAAMNPDLHPGRYACLSVEDSGHGMDESTVRRIFEPFFTTKAVGEGTGLGLATVFGIVKGMGGTVLVESTPGRGARFDVLLPSLTEGTAAALDPQDTSPEPSECRTSFD